MGNSSSQKSRPSNSQVAASIEEPGNPSNEELNERHSSVATATPNDKPKRRTRSINHRKALAGKYLMQGAIYKDALIKAGYSPSTARCPERNNLNVEQCLKELQKLDPAPDTKEILQSARRVFSRKLLELHDDTKLSKTRIGEIAKVVDVAEKYHGATANHGTGTARGFVDRLQWLADVADELRKRGALPQGQGTDTAHGHAIDVEPVSSTLEHEHE